MHRFKENKPGEMTPEQAEVWSEICAARPSPAGPFNAWLASPGLAQKAADLGAYVRLHTSLEPRLSELAILITARHWDCSAEWAIHEPFAKKAGVPDEVIKALNHKQEPVFAHDGEAAVYAFCRQSLEKGQVADSTYELCEELLGHKSVVELVGLIGYYCLVALSLNIMQVPLPEGCEATLEGAEVF
ncbi:MAG: hypothetical protein KQH53_06210 [Desulfarculaceae bacterium]|nr:hypothetical protein [Desulfarculaceae bacterium]